VSSSNAKFDKELVKSMAEKIRVNSLKMIHAAKSGHPGGSLSVTDILATLYFGGHLFVDPLDPKNPKRDILVMSKGHASAALYSALALKGFFAIEDTLSFRSLGSPFQGHIDRLRVPGVEVSTGSLGHGLSNALGFALAAKLENNPKKIFVILSDGEMQEGQTWEAAMAAAHYKTSNLIGIIDRNRIQLDGFTETTMSLNPLPEKLRAFNWEVLETDGHELEDLNTAILETRNSDSEKPKMIIAKTIKGKGVSFMEDQVSWHGVAPRDEELSKALVELGAKP
jgi:transketolase